MNIPNESLAKCHTSALKSYNDSDIFPVAPIRKCGRPLMEVIGSIPRRLRNQSGSLQQNDFF